MDSLRPSSSDGQPPRRPARETIRSRRYHHQPKAFKGPICAPPLQQNGASNRLFADRTDAGGKLAALLREFTERSDAIVIAIPRGGVVVGAEIARTLRLPFNLWLSRKLSPPQHLDLAFGSIAEDGDVVMDEAAINTLRIPPHHLVSELNRQRAQIAQFAEIYRQSLQKAHLEGKTVLLVDDGMSTGSTVRAAVKGILREQAARVIIAMPVAPHGAEKNIVGDKVEFVACVTPQNFYSIAQYYGEFPKIGDERVQKILREMTTPAASAPDDSDPGSAWTDTPWM